MTIKRRLLSALLALLTLAPVPAHASGEPLIGFGERVISFLTGPLAVIVGTIGLIAAGYCYIAGNREGLMRAVSVVIGAAIVFSASNIINFIAQAIH